MKAGASARIPPQRYFVTSALFHYLGPSFDVLLFASVPVLGVAWFRIASAAVVFALWRRPWRVFASLGWKKSRTLIAFGVVLGLMNACFYLAISRIPLGTVGAIEFIGPIALAALGARTPRNISALVLAAAGGWLLAHARLAGGTARLPVRICKLHSLHAVHRPRSQDRAGRRGSGDRSTGSHDARGARDDHPLRVCRCRARAHQAAPPAGGHRRSM
jgi:hypothetical protein